MAESVAQRCAAISDDQTRRTIQPLMHATFDRSRNVSMANAGLVIAATGSAIPKLSNAWFGVAEGVPLSVTAATPITSASMVGLSLTSGQVGIIGINVDPASSITCNMGTPGTSLAAATFPVAEGKATLGYMIVTAATTAVFTGGTTPLDSSATGAACSYISPLGMSLPVNTK